MECEKCNQKYKSTSAFKRHKCKICTHCNKIFKSKIGLQKHLQKREDISCDHCEQKFCGNHQLNSHKRSIKIPDINQEIYESPYKDYQKVIERNIKHIQDKVDKRKIYTVYNKQIDSSFTYQNLYDIYLNIYQELKSPFRTNLGFGYILHNRVSDEYKYHYVSDNTLVFERMPTIVKRKDITKLMKGIISADLPTTYFLSRPTSNWNLTALTNVEIKVIPYGAHGSV